MLMAIQFNENFETVFQLGLNESYNPESDIAALAVQLYTVQSINIDLMNIRNPFEIFINGFEGKIFDFIGNFSFIILIGFKNFIDLLIG